MSKSPSKEPLVLEPRTIPSLVNTSRDMLTRVMCSRRLPSQQFSVPCVQELPELLFVVEGRQDDVSPLPAVLVIPVVPRDKPPDAVITGVDCAHGVTVERWHRTPRGSAEARSSAPLNAEG